MRWGCPEISELRHTFGAFMSLSYVDDFVLHSNHEPCEHTHTSSFFLNILDQGAQTRESSEIKKNTLSGRVLTVLFKINMVLTVLYYYYDQHCLLYAGYPYTYSRDRPYP